MDGHDTTACRYGWGVRTPRLRLGATSIATERDVGDDGVLATEDGLLEALGRLVVQEPLPPVTGDVLG
jgi:hypothetical protein